MKSKQLSFFWIGFFLSTIVVAWLYLLWRTRKVITPEPLIISRSEPFVPETVGSRSDIQDQDDLEQIVGIGPATARVLNENGIKTFRQLAELSAGELEEIVGSSRWDPSDWIEQANLLAKR